jgi:hypothetical protein
MKIRWDSYLTISKGEKNLTRHNGKMKGKTYRYNSTDIFATIIIAIHSALDSSSDLDKIPKHNNYN